jgi:hypothetical protein
MLVLSRQVASLNPVVRLLVRHVYGGDVRASHAEAVAHYHTACALAPQRLTHRTELGKARRARACAQGPCDTPLLTLRQPRARADAGAAEAGAAARGAAGVQSGAWLRLGGACVEQSSADCNCVPCMADARVARAQDINAVLGRMHTELLLKKLRRQEKREQRAQKKCAAALRSWPVAHAARLQLTSCTLRPSQGADARAQGGDARCQGGDSSRHARRRAQPARGARGGRRGVLRSAGERPRDCIACWRGGCVRCAALARTHARTPYHSSCLLLDAAGCSSSRCGAAAAAFRTVFPPERHTRMQRTTRSAAGEAHRCIGSSAHAASLPSPLRERAALRWRAAGCGCGR